MKMIKALVSSFFIISMIYNASQLIINNQELNKIHEAYNDYYNENTEIKVKLKNENFNYYDDLEYKKQFNDTLEIYNKISKEKNVERMDISYCLSLGELQYLVSEKRFETYEQELTNGRYFTNEELENGNYVAIISESASDDPDKFWKIGDKVILQPYDDLNGIEVEIIGTFKSSAEWDGNSFYLNDLIYMPSKTIEKISDHWLKESKNTDNNQYVRMGIMDPVITCKSEKEYDELIETLNNYKQIFDMTFTMQRMDHHQVTSYESDISKIKNSIIKYQFYMILFFSIFVVIEISSRIIENKKQRNYEKRLLEEQENNIQNILVINQESRKLKHDLKHFLSHLSSLVEEKRYDEVTNLLMDYYEEIESLEIPAFTTNHTIDLVINNFLVKAKKKEINFTYSSVLVDTLSVADRKLYILLSNALDNAFEHCDYRKIVNLEINYIGNYYRFIITNSTQEEGIKKRIVTKEHGFGTMSMNQIIYDIHGEITNETENGMYICTILIPSRK